MWSIASSWQWSWQLSCLSSLLRIFWIPRKLGCGGVGGVGVVHLDAPHQLHLELLMQTALIKRSLSLAVEVRMNEWMEICWTNMCHFNNFMYSKKYHGFISPLIMINSSTENWYNSNWMGIFHFPQYFPISNRLGFKEAWVVHRVVTPLASISPLLHLVQFPDRTAICE